MVLFYAKAQQIPVVSLSRQNHTDKESQIHIKLRLFSLELSTNSDRKPYKT